MDYGLVASILVSTALVAVLAYRLDGSRWRWPMVALALAGIGTAVGILWIRRYIDRQPKASDQGSQKLEGRHERSLCSQNAHVWDKPSLSGSSGLSGLFSCLNQRNQKNQINETDQIDRTDQMNKTVWWIFSAFC